MLSTHKFNKVLRRKQTLAHIAISINSCENINENVQLNDFNLIILIEQQIE